MNFLQLKEEPYFRCLMPLLENLGWKGTEKELNKSLPYHFDYFGDNEFIATLSALGFKVRFHKGQQETNTIDQYPSLFISEGQVRVLIRDMREEYLIFDPYQERYERKSKELLDGVFIFFSRPDDYEVNLLGRSQGWFQLLTKRFKFQLVQVFFLSLVLSLLALISPIFVILVYNQVAIAHVETNFYLMSFGIVIFIVSQVGFKFIRTIIISSTTTRMNNILGREVFKRLLYFPTSISDSASVGNQLARLRDFNSIVNFFSGPGFIALVDLPFIIILILGMAFIGGEIALIPFGAILIFIFLGSYFSPLVKKFGTKNSELNKQKSEYLLETFTKFNSIRDFSLEYEWLSKFRRIHHEHCESKMTSSALNSRINILSNAVITLAALLTIGFGVTLVIKGEMNAGSLMASVLILWKVLNPLKTIFTVSAQIHRLRGSINQINKFMNLPQEDRRDEDLIYYEKLKGRFHFNQVSLRYPKNPLPTLIGVDFEVRENDTFVLLGHQGSGKSSLIKLMLGLLSPQSGTILIDNHNLKQLNPAKLRGDISFSPQLPSFFDETIFDSFLLANPHISEDQVSRILSDLGLNNHISQLEQGIHTRINESDPELFPPSTLKLFSIGINLASQSDILIFDGLAVNLSGLELEIVKDTIAKYRGKKTIIITTEDFSLIEIADSVLWLDKGRVKIFGPKEKVGEIILEKNKEFVQWENQL